MQACNGDAALAQPAMEQALVQFLNTTSSQVGAKQWAQHCREHVPDLAMTVSRWLRQWKIP